MGAMHANVYKWLPDARVVAVVDPRAEAARETLRSLGLGDIPVYADYDQAAKACEFTVVDICLPTDLHRDIALRAFAEGRHVFCEKPIALTLESAREITAAARGAARELMVGHCIRFWPEYVELKRIVDSSEHGCLLSLSMSRRTGRPSFTGGDWANQPARCLGAALDLHIHDTDFLVHLLGTPQAVVSRGTLDTSGWSGISTQYHFDGKAVTAEGGWNYPKNWGFQMRFAAVFECAALDFDSRAPQALLLTSGEGRPVPISLAQPIAASSATTGNITSLGGYYSELSYFIDYLERGKPVVISTGEQATESLRVVLAEIESARQGKLISLNL